MTACFRLFCAMILVLSVFGATAIGVAEAQEARNAIKGTGHPLPRFMTLKSNKVFMRTGPSLQHPPIYIYQRRGMPMKVLREFYVWREVVDIDGTRGWIHATNLLLKRRGMIIGADANIMAAASTDAPIVAQAEKGVVVALLTCEGAWCRITHSDLRGWIERRHLWGVFDDEDF